jgi:hypothetical protein
MSSKIQTIVIILIGVLIGCSVSMGQTMIQGTVAIPSTGVIDYTRQESSKAELPRLAGWDLKGMNWQLTANSWENPQVFAQMRAYGVNMVRRHFSSDPITSGGSTRTTYINRMKNIASMTADNGMWIIFDMYAQYIYAGSGGLEAMRWQWQMPEEDFLDMWEDLARELKSYGNVILELGNEPNDAGMSPAYPEHDNIWFSRCVKAIQRMRAVGFENYIVIPLPEVATDGQAAQRWRDDIRNADPLDRYMWDFHYYWYWQESQAGTPNDTSEAAIRNWLSNHGISQLLAMGDRVLCGEFGVHGQTYDSRDMTHFQNEMKVFNQDHYDYCAQSYISGTDFPMLTGTSISSSDWKTLNTQGQYYVDALSLNISYYE